MAIFENFPYTNMHELNLDWILRKMKAIEDEMKNLIEYSIIKYADPLQWDITSQYAKNTIVVNGYMAYLSKEAVPSGILISDTNYWLPVADFFRDIDDLRDNIADVNAGTSETTPEALSVNDLVWWNDVLYICIADMPAGTAFISGTNVRPATVEDYVETLIALEKTQREDSDADILIESKNYSDQLLVEAKDYTNEKVGEVTTSAYVNVKDFGAVGDAKYFDIATNSYWADAAFSVAPTDDTEAINSAITYALNNNIKTVYFPKGYYYLPGWSYRLDVSKLSFVGSGETALVSSGLTSGAFITLISPLDLDEYNTASVPLRDIALWGDKDPMLSSNVVGLRFDIPQNLVNCHNALYNIVVKNFGRGIEAGQAYKTIFYNLSVVACYTGIYLLADSAIPLFFIGGFIECCTQAINNKNTGWGIASFTDFAIEYNRQQVASAGHLIFNNCRFEFDPRTTATNYSFNLLDKVSFNDCDFLMLPNYVQNAQHWINNPSQYVKSEITEALFVCNSSLPSNMNYCRIGLDSSISIGSGFYLIVGTAGKLLLINSKSDISASYIDPNVIGALNSSSFN